jgi:hypothetical protein
MNGIFGFLSGDPGQSHGAKLAELCSHPGWRADPSPLPESKFEQISREMEAMGMPASWVRRPRIYFLLSNIRKIDTMDMFITQGQDDTFIPYPDRRALPSGEHALLDFDEAADFLKLQSVCESDELHVERGKHCMLQDGDTLFERHKIKLGVGSQG